MNEFGKRLLTGILFVGIIVGSILWNQWAFFAVFGIINLLTLREFYKLYLTNKTIRLLGIIAGVHLYLATITFYNPQGIVRDIAEMLLSGLFAQLGVFFTCFLLLIIDKDSDPVKEMGALLFGGAYVALPFTLFSVIGMANAQYNSHLLLAPLILTWVNDTGAYLTGMLVGKKKFFERLSPKKTWAGVAGGIIFTLYFSVVVWLLFGSFSWIHWFFISLIVSLAAISGDLFESLLKRKLQIKDTGNILPGHGGMLDRFDALLFVIPFYFIYLLFFVF